MILRVPGGKPGGRDEFGPEPIEVRDAVERLAGEELARRLVEHLDLPVFIDGKQRARRIVDDRGEIAHLRALRRVPRLERLQRAVERVAEDVEAAAARVREALRIILEPHRFDEARDEEIGAADELPQAGQRGDGDQRGDDEPGTDAGCLDRCDDQQDGARRRRSCATRARTRTCA